MLFFFFFFFSAHSLHIPNRRILHQPLLPLNPIPPSPSPSPPTPKFTSSSSSSSTSTPPNSPFFPFYPSPPPPPSPSTSFPANISSLNLPHSPSPTHSHKTLFLSIAAVASASLIVSLLLFFYCRRRERNSLSDSNNKTSSLNNNNAGGPPRLRTTSSSTSSEFLYLGTLSNSQNGSNSNNVSRFNPRKMDSPELQPLPPLSGRIFREVESVTEEEEEFYSPRGSLGGSGSRRVFVVKSIESTSSSTCSSSSPVSFSPGRSYSKSPEQHSLSPEMILADSPMLSNAYNGNLRSPSLSLTSKDSELRSPSLSPMPVVENPDSSSPNRVLIEKLDTSKDSLSDSPASTSPERVLIEKKQSFLASPSPDRALNEKEQSFSASSSPDRALIEKEQSFSASPSPDRTFEKSSEMPPLMVAVWDYNKDSSFSSSDFSSSGKDLDTSPVRNSMALEKPISTPPPPPPPLPKQRRLWERPVSSVSVSELPATVPAFTTQTPITKSPSPSAPPPPPPPPKQRRLWEKPVSSVSELPATMPTFMTQTPITNSPAPPPPPPRTVSVSDLPATIPMTQNPITNSPPPPPPLPPRRLWEKPVLSGSSAQQISELPHLMPPTKPTTNSIESEAMEDAEEASKPKLKTLHWDKVRASSDREMVWDHLGSSSFKLNEEMIETLFIANTSNSKPKQTTLRPVLPSPKQENRVLDPKKAQNIAILLRALHVTVEEVCDALLEGNADTLGTELLESLLKMAPTKEEERKLKEYKDDSPVKLGHAEKFLKTVLDIPFAFKRVHSMLYIANFESEIEYLKKSFETLEAACEELRNCRMFLKLLEAVLKTGNRMNVGTNRGDARAFKLDTLLKLVDVKGADGETTLLHFVVQEITRIEGARLSNANQTPSSNVNEDARCRKLGLQVISSLSSELTNVKKAATMDSEVLSGDVSKLSRGLEDINEVLKLNETMGSDERFSESMNKFTRTAEEEIIRIQAHESVALSLVKEITEYFHGNSAKEEAHPFRIFMVVRDFLTVVERVCKECGMVNERSLVSSAHKLPVPVNPMMQPVFPVPVNPMHQAFHGRPHYGSDDDDESSSP